LANYTYIRVKGKNYLTKENDKLILHNSEYILANEINDLKNFV